MNSYPLRNLSYGVYVVSTMDGDSPTGCIANSIMQITSSPQTVAVSINHDNYTNGCIKKSGRFAVSILAETSDPSLIGTFGFQSGKDVRKFAGTPAEEHQGLFTITDACAFFICKVTDTLETSTHTIFLGEVFDGDILDKRPPMTYAYYHQVIKGKSPKNAPTYIPEAAAPADKDTAKYQCTLCGYIYDGDTPFADLPDDYHCPICQALKEKFKQI